jgi:hypothetical protein
VPDLQETRRKVKVGIIGMASVCVVATRSNVLTAGGLNRLA